MTQRPHAPSSGGVRPEPHPEDGKSPTSDPTTMDRITLEQIPTLIAEGRRRLAEFEANPTAWSMLMHSQWATGALPHLLDALDAKSAQHAETLGYLERAYEVIEKDSAAYHRALAELWKSRRYWQRRALTDITERPTA